MVVLVVEARGLWDEARSHERIAGFDEIVNEKACGRARYRVGDGREQRLPAMMLLSRRVGCVDEREQRRLIETCAAPHLPSYLEGLSSGRSQARSAASRAPARAPRGCDNRSYSGFACCTTARSAACTGTSR